MRESTLTLSPNPLSLSLAGRGKGGKGVWVRVYSIAPSTSANSAILTTTPLKASSQ